MDSAPELPAAAPLPHGKATYATASGVALALERELQARRFACEDACEGIAAFVEKRRPCFGGR